MNIKYKSLIEAKLKETQEKLNSLGLKPFYIPFAIGTLPKGVSGRAWGSERFEISIDYLDKHTEQVIARTVPHEIAHCYVAKYYPNAVKGHGKEWKRLMEALGCEQSRYHTMKLTADAPVEVKKVHEIKKDLVGFYDVIWNKTISKYEGFVSGKVVAIDKSYREVKKIMESEYGCTLFNVVTPCF